MNGERSIRFRSGDVELGGRLAVPNGATRACVLCHPHPLYGGDMNNSVVIAVAEALGDAGVATLRFDFRGAGTSGGAHGGGGPEVGDARAAVDALAAAAGVGAVSIAGYSFGSLIALRLAAEAASESDAAGPARHDARAPRVPRVPRISGVAAIAPPLAMFDASFAAGLRAPLLLLAGDRDAYCPRGDFEALAARLPGHATARLLPGADHFFAGREGEVAGAVTNWLTAA